MIKKYIYLRKNFKQYLRAEKKARAAILPIKQGKIPVIVHTMGQVGSTTLERSLKQDASLAVFHTHFLSKSGIKNNWITETNNFKSKRIPYHLLEVNRLRRVLKNLPQRDIYIISSVRDVIARQISSLYKLPTIAEKNIQDEQGQANSQLVSKFFNEFVLKRPNFFHYPLNWFDKEVKACFDIDVFEHSFDPEQGYVIIRKGNVNLLVLHMEKIDALMPTVISEFLSVENSLTSIRSNVQQNSTYKDAVSNVKIPNEILDRVYSSKLMAHFYSEEKRIEFKKRWNI
ncbi:hypothetical protein GCM10009117_24000 [Gangjinia marincola]|uniref:Uncharacterized protein n=1 Tax=Gangjinia marincola TaxID=578463 RepID=A0ABN1MK56_9FLAO